jgi:hypothetical protein
VRAGGAVVARLRELGREIPLLRGLGREVPLLRGLGREIHLPARAIVGRGAECDIVLDDASVSRRHAELVRDARGSYAVRDLSSGNGTFLEGVRVGERPVPVPAGSRLRFGEVELRFLTAASRRIPPRLALAVCAAAVLVVVAVAAGRRRPETQTRASAPSARAAALAEEAQAALDGERYEEAAALAQEAARADPLLDAARAALAQARRERDAAGAYADATVKAQVGGESDALHLLARIPIDSRLFARARIKAKDLGAGIVRDHSAACRAESDAERWAQAAAECALALEVKCQLGPLERDPLLALLRASERGAGRKVRWTCPADLAALFRDEAPGSAKDEAPEAALALLHPDAQVRAAVVIYARGHPAEAARALARKSSPTARAAAERIRTVDGRAREGQTALLAGEVLRADRAYQEALRIDGELVPAAVESLPARQIRAALAQVHGRIGDEQFAKGQYASAYDEWMKGLAASPTDPHLLDSVARLEKVAEGIVQDPAASCAELKLAEHVVRAGRPLRDAAAQALGRCR